GEERVHGRGAPGSSRGRLERFLSALGGRLAAHVPYYRSMGWDRELQALEDALRNLNAQYDAFLYGSSHRPPLEIRRRIGQQIQRLSHTESESSAERFRFTALQV